MWFNNCTFWNDELFNGIAQWTKMKLRFFQFARVAGEKPHGCFHAYPNPMQHMTMTPACTKEDDASVKMDYVHSLKTQPQGMVSDWMVVALGGAIGAVLRFYVSETVSSEGFPWATLTVNLIGSLLLGVMTAAVAASTLSETQALLLGTGILGAFTTLSTFSVETATLYDEEQWSSLLGYVASSALGGPLLALVGWRVGSSVLFPLT